MALQIESLLASIFLFLAVCHAVSTPLFARWAHRHPEGSGRKTFLHFLSEVEVVFGFWAFCFLLLGALIKGSAWSEGVLSKTSFTEAAFVFVILCMCATKPILSISESALRFAARAIPLPRNFSLLILLLTVGPLLGSLITEPAAMTVLALTLKPLIFERQASLKLKYDILGALFVHVSIGGCLTAWAAPPVLMVAESWGWDTPHMIRHYGLAAVVSVLVSGFYVIAKNFRELKSLLWDSHAEPRPQKKPLPTWMVLTQLAFVALVIMRHNNMAFFIPLFLIFLGWVEVTEKYQTPLKIREALLVGFFLGGLVILGQFQGWWIPHVLEALGTQWVGLGATVLTSVTDNAALTYLGSLVPDMPPAAQHALVAGALAGGGLTVLANAPNPAGAQILSPHFPEERIGAVGLLKGAFVPTLIACLFFTLLD